MKLRKSLVLAVISVTVFVFALGLTMTDRAYADYTSADCCAELTEIGWAYGHTLKLMEGDLCVCVPSGDPDVDKGCFHGCPRAEADPPID